MTSLKDLLRSKLTQKQLSLVPKSFDIVGNILIFSDFPNELSKKQKIIAQTILDNHKNISSVYKKSRKYGGKYRTPKLTYILGEKNKVTEYKENNSRIRLNVEKVYFSPRLSTERKRIFSQVKKNEKILVLFSGSGIYPITIAKNAQPKEILGIEMNPLAHKFAQENIILNKVQDKIKLINADVKKALPKISKKFDRILMPLPKDAETFLDITLKKAKKGTIIHLYAFEEPGNYDIIKKTIKESCKCRILKVTPCGQFSPKLTRVCVDFKLLN